MQEDGGGQGEVLSQISSSGYSWLYSPEGLWCEPLPYKTAKLEAPCRRNTYLIYMCFTVELLCINAQYIDIYCENSCFINMELFCFLDLCQFPINTEIRQLSLKLSDRIQKQINKEQQCNSVIKIQKKTKQKIYLPIILLMNLAFCLKTTTNFSWHKRNIL